MTPKEKAEKLIAQCSLTILSNTGHKLPMDEIKVLAKQCALIAVDEMLIHVDMVDDDAAINYWKQVKQEIENI